ncbi:unnamed protein product, partial [marine sediment metagenome]
MPSISILACAFGLGFIAAAPLGPVNMVAIRRGLVVRWTRTIWVGFGSVAFETVEVALILWGGQRLIERIPVEFIQRYVSLPAAGIVLLVGLFLLRRAVVPPRRMLAAIRAERDTTPPHWCVRGRPDRRRPDVS